MYTLLWLKLSLELRLLASGSAAEKSGEVSDKSHLCGLPESTSVSNLFFTKKLEKSVKKCLLTTPSV